MNDRIDLGPTKPCCDFFRITKGLEQVGKALQSTADHFVAAKERIKTMSSGMNEGIKFAATEQFGGGQNGFESFGFVQAALDPIPICIFDGAMDCMPRDAIALEAVLVCKKTPHIDAT